MSAKNHHSAAPLSGTPPGQSSGTHLTTRQTFESTLSMAAKAAKKAARKTAAPKATKKKATKKKATKKK